MPGEPHEPPLDPPPADVPPPAGASSPDAVAVSGVAVKRRSPLVPILAGVVAAVVAIVAVVLLTRGDDDGADDPAAVVREYFTAFRDGDCEAAFDLIDTDGEPGEPSRESMVDACRQAYDEERASLEGTELASVELVEEEGDRATVRTSMIEPGASTPGEPEEVPLVRVDGDWKIDMSERVAAPEEDAAGGGTGP